MANPGGLRRPCAKCPFRSDREPYIEYMRAVEIAGTLYLGNEFPCHETTTHDDDGEYVHTRDEMMCAGAAITMLKAEGPNQMMRILGRLYPGYIEALEEEMPDAPLYEDLEEWISAHDPGGWVIRDWRRKREREQAREKEAAEEAGPRAETRAQTRSR